MYAMRWHKPLAPKEPFVLKGDWVRPMCAYMFMSSEMSGEVDPNSIESQTTVKTLFAFLHLYSKIPETESMSFSSPKDVCTIDNTDTESLTSARQPGACHLEVPELAPTSSFTPAPKSCLAALKSKKLEKAAGTAFFERRPRVKGSGLDSKTASEIAINRWALAASTVTNHPAIQAHYTFHSHNQDRCVHFKAEELVVPRF